MNGLVYTEALYGIFKGVAAVAMSFSLSFVRRFVLWSIVVCSAADCLANCFSRLWEHNREVLCVQRES